MNKRYILLICTVFLLIIRICNSNENPNEILNRFLHVPSEDLFNMYHLYFNKTYLLGSYEAAKRFNIFNDNLDYINEVNSRNLTYKLGIGPFTDMTNVEYREKILMKEKDLLEKFGSAFEEKSPDFLHYNDKNHKKTKEVPFKDTINWSRTMRPARDQGVCGCCWAFASLLATEGNYYLANDELISLSVQQLVDCNYSNKACLGGWPSYAFDYMKGAGNALEQNYQYYSSYTGKAGDCTYRNDGLQILIGYQQCPLNNCDLSSWTDLLSQGPLTAAMDASSPDFQNYQSGVLDISNCGQLNHAIVPYGMDSDSQGPFISVRNSYSKYWGMAGDFQIRYNNITNTCGVTSTGWLPQVQKGGPTPPYPPSNCISVYDQCAYTGNTLQICESINDLSTKSFNNTISSVQIMNATQVSLFSDVNCCGNSVTLSNDENCIDTDSNPAIHQLAKRSKSVSILGDLPPSGCIWVYQGCCYNTGRQEFCNDVGDLTPFSLEDKISSIKLGANVQSVILFIDPNFSGLAYGLNQDSGCLNQNDSKIFYLQVSSFRLIR